MESAVSKVATGIQGLDEVLQGGVLPTHSILISGGPGSGKTTLGMHFLVEETEGESLFVTLGETADQLRKNAARLHLALDGVEVLDLSPGGAEEDGDTYSLLESWDVEGTAIHDQIVKRARELQPARIFIDSVSHMRYLSSDTFQYRKQVMSMLRKLTSTGATVLFTSEQTRNTEDEALSFLSDGIIDLQHEAHGRLCQIKKLRGSGFVEGTHYYSIHERGLTLYPRLLPGEHGRHFELNAIGSGVPELDELTRGGIERGTVTLVTGPTGVGKTTMAAQFMKEAASRGEHSVIYNFDEGAATFFLRCDSIGLPARQMTETGNLRFESIEPLHYNPDQFANVVRHDVEKNNARLVLLDSLSGYRQSVRGEDLQERVHALCRYLVNMGVTVLLISETFSITGEEARVTEHEVSYLADTIILLRYLELSGEIRKTIGVLKKRTGDFEKTLREFEISRFGLKVGEPLTSLRGILTGMPEMLEDRERGH
ncbi:MULTISPECIES: ATPase domain-containing protein [Halomonadaceae]|jgi:circadian clock protein KaiC|uniref:non-specific serine/threonine protein kinase n=1 Tax=Vreelandella halophila TaxID=86177 RepID=A0A9X4YCI2_9GAMM|nr:MULTISPECIES: ATPase domain-containing protein [Halomonas]MYL27199.1 AAA family ATPase [Halomonas utahensis]MYL74401.1 AAA family ATPase [Halomonas sp. 22501_18_FS]